VRLRTASRDRIAGGVLRRCVGGIGRGVQRLVCGLMLRGRRGGLGGVV
jgi:hypothetical protein